MKEQIELFKTWLEERGYIGLIESTEDFFSPAESDGHGQISSTDYIPYEELSYGDKDKYLREYSKETGIELLIEDVDDFENEGQWN